MHHIHRSFVPHAHRWTYPQTRDGIANHAYCRCVSEWMVESAISYLKLRKIKRMLLENQLDLEKPHTEEEYNMLNQTHEHLKKMEMELTKKSGTVIIK